MKKFAFFDIDGTLVPENQTKIPDDVVKALKTIMDNGVEVFICTGRCYMQAKHIIDKIGTSNYICSNGQEVCYHGEIIYKHIFTSEMVEKFCQLFTDNDLCWGFETRDNLCVPRSEKEYEHKKLLEAYNFDNLMIGVNHLESEIYQFWFHGTTKQVQPVIDFINNSDNSYFQWRDDLFEVLPGNENKAKAIKFLKEYINEEIVTYSFGDGPNDIEMMKTTDHSVSMGNAIDIVKEASEFVSTNSSDNGIINGLKLVGLLDE